MEETWEYRDNEKVMYKDRFTMKFPEKTLEDVECLVTQEHIYFEAEEKIRIPVSLIQKIDVPMQSVEFSSASQQSQKLYSGSATLTYLDNANNKKSISLVGVLGSLHSFKKEIDAIKEMSWLLEGLKKVGWLVEAVEGNKVKLHGQSIYAVGYTSGYSLGSKKSIKSIFFEVRTDILQKSDNPKYDDSKGIKVAEINKDIAGAKWTGGEQADRLNEDFEIARLLKKLGETEIEIRAHIESGNIIISHQTAVEMITEYPFELFDRIAKHSREIKIEAVAISDTGSRKRKGVPGSIVRKELSPNWLIKYLMKVVGIFSVCILFGVFVKGWSWPPHIVGTLVGVFMAVWVGMAYADETPLRKYSLIRGLSRVLQAILEKGP